MIINATRKTNSKQNPLDVDPKTLSKIRKYLLSIHFTTDVWMRFTCRSKWCKGKNNIVIKKIALLKDFSVSNMKCRQCCTKETNLERYNCENVFQNEEIKGRMRQTNLEKLGVENPSQSEEIKKKKEQTCLKHHGFKYATQSEEIKEKIKRTNQERYHTDWTCQNQEVREKQYATQRKHYGGKLFLSSDIGKEQIKQTNLRKYHVENPFQSETFQEKARQTRKERYGVAYIQQLPDYDHKSAQKKRKATLKNHYDMEHSPRKIFNYNGEYFDSSWELAVYIWAIDHNKKIVREPCSFDYKYGKYFPDFKIGRRYIEIKGDQFFTFYKNGKIKTMINPFKREEDYIYKEKYKCMKEHNVSIWMTKEMSPILKYIKTKYGNDYLESFRRTKE